jgi:signal transduction histidine kinase
MLQLARRILRSAVSSPAAASPAAERFHTRRARRGIFVIDLIASALVCLIYYPFATLPYLLIAIVVTSLWRFRAGVIALAVALPVLTAEIALSSPEGWKEWLDPGGQNLLALCVASMMCLGFRWALDELERLRHRERELAEQLARAIAQLQEGERAQAIAAQQLAERNSLLRAMLDAVDNGIFLANPEGRIVFANERLGHLLEIDAEQLVGQEARAAVLDHLPPATDGAHRDRLYPSSDLFDASRRLIEVDRPTPRLLCESSCTVPDDDGVILGRLYFYSDLPSRELLEQRVAERTRELQETQEQLLRSTRLAVLGQFSATMAHELRNPLNVVRLAAHYLTTHVPADEKIQRNLANLNQHLDRACDIITDLLAFSRFPPPRLQPTSINEVVRRAASLLPAMDRVSVELSLAPGCLECRADARQIEQVVNNLGLNALQAMSEGGRLAISTHACDDRVQIAVRDTGPGVPTDLRAHIWEPFFSTKATGTGLGLPLVREIAIAHGGRVWHSSDGKETVFTVEIPAEPAAGRPSSA